MLVKTAPDLVKYAMMLGDTFALASHWSNLGESNKENNPLSTSDSQEKGPLWEVGAGEVRTLTVESRLGSSEHRPQGYKPGQG